MKKKISQSIAVLAIILVGGFLGMRSSHADNSIERVSIASDGSQGNNYSNYPDVSADGRFVAFQSSASNLVPGDTNNVGDIFVHDRQTGETTRVSVASDGTQADDYSGSPAISSDGRFIAFVSSATNLVSEDTNGVGDIFVHDRQTGQTTRASVASDGTQGNVWAIYPDISDDGRYVIFTAADSNLTSGDTNGQNDIFIHDQITGTTEIVSVSSNGSIGSGYYSSISADGRYVAFSSGGSDLVSGDTNDKADVFVRDRQTGQTTRVSVASDGTQANGYSGDYLLSISSDGRYVTFTSSASNLVSGDTNNRDDIFVHDRQTKETSRVSIASDGTQGNGSSFQPTLSANGRYVAFYSYSWNLVSGDTNDGADLFIHDRQTGQTAKVSHTIDWGWGFSGSDRATISADGSRTAFVSRLSNLISGDTNNATDVFVAENPLFDATPPSTTQVTLTITIDPEEGGLVKGDGIICVVSTCAGTYTQGTTVNLEAIANEGYEFESWDNSSESKISVYMNSDYSLKATFGSQSTHKVAYIPIVFPDGSEYTHEVEDLKKRAKEVGDYYYEQSYGDVAISSNFISDNWFQLDKKLADFPGEDTEKWNNVRNYVIYSFAKKINPSFDIANFDSVVVIVPECMQPFANPVKIGDVWAPGKEVIASEKYTFSTWAHELGHSLFKFNDYYDYPYLSCLLMGKLSCKLELSNGDIGYWGLMGGGTLMNPSSPLMSYNKVEKGWLAYKDVSFGEQTLDFLTDWNPNNKEVFRFNTDNTKSAISSYIFEGRNLENEFSNLSLKDDLVPTGGYCNETLFENPIGYKLKKEKGIELYKVTGDNPLTGKPKIYTQAHPEVGIDDNNKVTFVSGDSWADDDAGVKFSVAENSNGKMVLDISKNTPLLKKVISFLGLSGDIENEIQGINSPLILENQLDVDSHVVSQDGKKVGMNYDTGEYEMQIDGANSSFDTPGGGSEWISVPDDVNASYYLDTTPLKKWAEEAGANVTNIKADFRVTTFDENGNRQDSEDMTIPVDLANPISPLAVKASVEINPKTLNLKSNGNWITTFVELPKDYDTRQIIGESVILNNQLKADKIEFGDFDSDGITEAMMKFDRTQVANILTASSTKKVTINGDFMHNGIPLPFVGESAINTISPGSSPKK